MGSSKYSGQNKKRVAVIGAGIVGISTAIWLQRAGYDVVVIDRKGPGEEASHGNGGVLAAISIVPVPVPGLLKKVPGMLMSKNAPLFLRWGYLPRLVPFLLKYLSHGNKKDVNRIADSLSLLLHDCADQHEALAKGTGAEKFIHRGDYLFGYKDHAAFVEDSFAWEIRRQRGHEFEELNEEQLAEYDPLLAGRFGYAVRCPNHGRISDPGKYMKALTAHVKDMDGELIKAEVMDVALENGLAKGLEISQGFVEADEIVLATGVWSGPLAKKLGVKVPLEAERGYHVEFINASPVPKSSMMVVSGKFVVTPMDGRLRSAGIVEFGGLSEKRKQAALDLLKRQSLELFPDLKYDRIDEWMGFRPATPDSLPLIGKFDKTANVWSAFGHQHIGLSGGPKTGRWVAQMIAGQRPNTDLTPFAPNRFQ